uniref:Thioredoxin domain-containing protein n=1 Tax=Trichuris muris TaxID=70415 RepID=A0A5S6QI18_TRIMR
MPARPTSGLWWIILSDLLLIARANGTDRPADGTVGAVEVLTKCNELLNAKTSNWKVRMFWRQLLRLCAMANRYFDNHLIVLFCGSTKRYPICRKVDGMLRQRVSNISADGRPAYIKTDNFAFGEDFSVHHFPALTYAVAGRLFHFTGMWNEEAVDKWISQMLTSSVRLVDSTNFEEVRQRHATSVVLLYLQEEKRCAAYAGKWWDYVAKSVHDRKDVDFLKLECSGVNGFFVEQRFSIDCTTPCPRVVLVADNHIKTFPLSIRGRGVAAQIRRFIETETTNPAGWQDLLAEPTDLEYLIFEMELTLAARMQRPLYIVTGFTGGFGVIVLAVSIFWGLKGNAFTVPLTPLLPR